MCSLYSFKNAAAEARSLLSYLEQPEFPPREVITPGSPIAIVRNERGARHFALVRWGFVPYWAKEIGPKPLINARSETIFEKASFKNAIRRRRCLIPADGFYEWKGDTPGQKQPYHIHKPDQSLFAFAGIWEQWMGADGSELETAAIITTGPNAEMATIHTRMPVLIEPEHFERWLDTDHVDGPQVADLMQPAPDGTFEMEPATLPRRTPPKAPPPPPPKAQLDLF